MDDLITYGRRYSNRQRNGARRNSRKRANTDSNDDVNDKDPNYPDTLNGNTNANTNDVKQRVESNNINYNSVPSNAGVTRDQLGEIIRNLVGRGKTNSPTDYDT